MKSKLFRKPVDSGDRILRSRRRQRRTRFQLDNLESRLYQSVTPVGVNIEEVKDWSRSFMFVDAMKSARAFGSAANPWDEAAPVDANGWPTGDAGACVITVGPPTTTGQDQPRIDGTYHFSATGNVQVGIVASNAFVTNRVYDADTNTTTADVVVNPGATQLYMNFTGAAGGAKNIKLIRPGYDPNTTQIFTDAFLATLTNVQTLRFMDYLQTNANPVVNWADRAQVTDADQTSSKGGAWEYAIDLANAAHKDMWINIPEGATDDYVTQLATLIKSNLDPGLHVYVEYSNEVWNGAFQQSVDNFTQAQVDEAANPSDLNYDQSNNTYYYAWRRVAERLVQIKDDFAGVYGQDAINTTIRPVLASQIGWTYILQNQLEYLESKYGSNLGSQIYGVAGAPYINIGDLSNSPTLTVDQVIGGLRADMASNQTAILQYQAMAVYYGLHSLFYEAGVDLSGNTSGNLSTKILANYDPQITQVIVDYLQQAAADGVSQVEFYNLSGAYGWDGTWGLTEDVYDTAGAKFAGLVQAANTPAPAVTGGFMLPDGTGADSLDGNAFNIDTWGAHGSAGVLRGLWAGNEYDYLVNAPSAGRYLMKIQGGFGTGTVEVYVDGKDIGQVTVSGDTTDSAFSLPIDLGAVNADDALGAGQHTIKIKTTGGHFDLAGLTFLGGADTLPAQVPGLTAVAPDNSSITLSWQDQPGQAGFVIQRSSDGLTGWTKLATVGTGVMTYTDAGLLTDTAYYYRAMATGLGGDSSYSEPLRAVTRALVTPQLLTVAANGTDMMTVTWQDVPGETGMNVERTDDPDGGDWTSLGTITDGSQTFTDNNLKAATKYFYRITATGPTGESGSSAVQGDETDAVYAPTVSVQAAPDGSIQLQWQAVPGAEGYAIQRSVDDARSWIDLAQAGSDATSWTDTGLAADVDYAYRVQAISSLGNSDFSLSADAVSTVAASHGPAIADGPIVAPVLPPTVPPVSPPVVPPVTPPVVTAPVTPPVVTPDPVLPPVSVPTLVSPGSLHAVAALSTIRLTWTASPSATSYTIQRTTDGNTWTTVGTSVGLSFTDAHLSQSTTYTYRITATAGALFSTPSATVSAMTAHLIGTTGYWWW